MQTLQFNSSKAHTTDTTTNTNTLAFGAVIGAFRISTSTIFRHLFFSIIVFSFFFCFILWCSLCRVVLHQSVRWIDTIHAKLYTLLTEKVLHDVLDTMIVLSLTRAHAYSRHRHRHHHHRHHRQHRQAKDCVLAFSSMRSCTFWGHNGIHPTDKIDMIYNTHFHRCVFTSLFTILHTWMTSKSLNCTYTSVGLKY